MFSTHTKTKRFGAYEKQEQILQLQFINSCKMSKCPFSHDPGHIFVEVAIEHADTCLHVDV